MKLMRKFLFYLNPKQFLATAATLALVVPVAYADLGDAESGADATTKATIEAAAAQRGKRIRQGGKLLQKIFRS